MGYIRSNEDYYRSIGRNDLADREVVIERNANKSPANREPLPGNYVGYKGTVDQQPDNPQNRYTDDD
jgi:hypothetical protein